MLGTGHIGSPRPVQAVLQYSLEPADQRKSASVPAFAHRIRIRPNLISACRIPILICCTQGINVGATSIGKARCFSCVPIVNAATPTCRQTPERRESAHLNAHSARPVLMAFCGDAQIVAVNSWCARGVRRRSGFNSHPHLSGSSSRRAAERRREDAPSRAADTVLQEGE